MIHTFVLTSRELPRKHHVTVWARLLGDRCPSSTQTSEAALSLVRRAQNEKRLILAGNPDKNFYHFSLQLG